MIRKIITIDPVRCNGCGLCINACHENAIGLVNGKAVLLRDDYCDGLGDCLPACPVDAISFEEREALPYDEAAVIANQQRLAQKTTHMPASHSLRTTYFPQPQWPLQLQLVPSDALFFAHAKLLLAADCTAFVHPHFAQSFMHEHALIIACPKLDHANYREKLTNILTHNAITTLTVVRMAVPCCSGLVQIAQTSIRESGLSIPLNVITLANDGTEV